MKKQIKVVVLNPERLSINLTNVIADIYEKRIAEGRPMPWEVPNMKT